MPLHENTCFVEITDVQIGEGQGTFIDGSFFVILAIRGKQSGEPLPNIAMRIEEYMKLCAGAEPILRTAMAKGWNVIEE